MTDARSIDFTRNYFDRLGTRDDLCRVGPQSGFIPLVSDAAFSSTDISRMQSEVRSTPNADATSVRERIAARTDDTTTRGPDPYRQSGRYREATNDNDVREGFRGERVRTVQQSLVDQGYLSGEHAVDGFWGPATQAAHDRFVADQRTIGGDSQAARADAVTGRTAYQPVADHDTTARDLSDDIRSGNTNSINRTLTNTSNADLRQLESRLERNADGSYSTMLPLTSNTGHNYTDLANRLLRGERNEGLDARADSRQVDDFQEQLLGARVGEFHRAIGDTTHIGTKWNGTDESTINRVFARASGAQLAAINERMRQGVRDENGDTVQFSDGLAGLIKSEMSDSPHRSLLLAQLSRPLS